MNDNALIVTSVESEYQELAVLQRCLVRTEQRETRVARDSITTSASLG